MGESELLGTEPKFRRRKKNSSSCVCILHNWNVAYENLIPRKSWSCSDGKKWARKFCCTYRLCFAFETYCFSPCFVAVVVAKAPYQLSHNGHKKCSLFTDPLFSLTNQSSVRLKNKTVRDLLTASARGRGWGFLSCPPLCYQRKRPLLLLPEDTLRSNSSIPVSVFPTVSVGKTGRRLADRLREHIHFTRLPDNDLPVGRHFTSPGHRIGDMLVSVIRFGFRSTTERRSFEASVIFRHHADTWTSLNVILEPECALQLYLNFSKSARTCNVSLCFDFYLNVTLRVFFELP